MEGNRESTGSCGRVTLGHPSSHSKDTFAAALQSHFLSQENGRILG